MLELLPQPASPISPAQSSTPRLVLSSPRAPFRRRRNPKPISPSAPGNRKLADHTRSTCNAPGRPIGFAIAVVEAALVAIVNVYTLVVAEEVPAAKVQAKCVGKVPQLGVTVPEYPPTNVTVSVVVPELPLLMVSDAGEACAVNPGAVTVCVSWADVEPPKIPAAA